MKIIETFICLIDKNNFVKVHRGLSKNGNSLYFIELKNGDIEEIGELYFESIKEVE